MKAFPTKDYMKVALGVLGWPPHCFWRATPNEVRIAFDGWSEVNGTKTSQQGMSHEKLAKLMKEYPDI